MTLQTKLDAFKADFEAGKPPYNVCPSARSRRHPDRHRKTGSLPIGSTDLTLSLDVKAELTDCAVVRGVGIAMRVTGLYHYPVKGLSPQALDSVELRPGEGFPFDRLYALARYDSGYAHLDYKPLPKTRFIVLVKEERLARLSTFADPMTKRFTIDIEGQRVLDASLDTAEGRREITEFFAQMFDLKGGREPILAISGANRFTDISVESPQMMNAISIINLQSVRELASRMNADINPLRFRANLYIDGLDGFKELDLIGQDIAIGSARLRLIARTRRCAATDVDPETAERNRAIPRGLMKNFGHADMGVYAEVIAGGKVDAGASLSVL